MPEEKTPKTTKGPKSAACSYAYRKRQSQNTSLPQFLIKNLMAFGFSAQKVLSLT